MPKTFDYTCRGCKVAQVYEAEDAVIVTAYSMGEAIRIRAKCPNCGARNLVGDGCHDPAEESERVLPSKVEKGKEE